MSTESLILLIVVVVAVLVVVGVLAMMASRRKAAAQAERDRAQAREIRSEAATTSTAVRDSDMRAREVQLEADRARLEAERAERRAAEAQQGARVEEALHEDKLREADRVDPDVDHRSEDYSPGAHADGVPDTRPDPAQGTATQGMVDPDTDTGQRIDPATGRLVDETDGTEGQRRDGDASR